MTEWSVEVRGVTNEPVTGDLVDDMVERLRGHGAAVAYAQDRSGRVTVQLSVDAPDSLAALTDDYTVEVSGIGSGDVVGGWKGPREGALRLPPLEILEMAQLVVQWESLRRQVLVYALESAAVGTLPAPT